MKVEDGQEKGLKSNNNNDINFNKNTFQTNIGQINNNINKPSYNANKKIQICQMNLILN